jgi:hypothetical protein
VSACLIVRDEAGHIGRCLESLRPLVDEVIVVDTGSTDDTTHIARGLGATVTEEPWQNDFSFHRNQAVDRAHGRWILTIDADEELVDTDVAETRQRLEADGLPDILLASLLLRYPDERTLSIVSPRLLRRGAGIRYVFPVHEQLEVQDAPAVLSNVKLLHHGYADVTSLERKERRNLHLAEVANDDGSPHILHCIVRSSFSLNDWLKTATTAKRLVYGDAPLRLKQEACALGAAASFNLRDSRGMADLVSAGIALEPDNPDIRLMAVVAAINQYLRTLENGDSTRDQLMLRPLVFHHSAATAREMLEVLQSSANRRQSNPGISERNNIEGSEEKP